MAIHKDTRDFLSMVDSIQSRYLQVVVQHQKDDRPKETEKQGGLTVTEADQHTGSQPGTFGASKP
jgi:hypothetical protein